MSQDTHRNSFATALDRQSGFLNDILTELDPAEWDRPTPAEGWTIRDQVGHLTFVYSIADLAVRDAGAFRDMISAVPSLDSAIGAQVDAYRRMPLRDLQTTWAETRERAVRSFSSVDPDVLVPWLVNPLPPAVLAAAGLMETFAHGQDVADAVGTTFPDSELLDHVVEFAIMVRDFGYEARGLTPPHDEFRFEITTGDGRLLTFGPVSSPDVVAGSAKDFCLLVTRRRHPSDVDITASGPNAPAWLEIAQAYRGSPGSGRQAKMRQG